jgi:hypothetical protein
MARDNLRCLPPTRTLPRIRWPLQPRSRDRRASFRRARRPLSDVLTSFWVLAGPSPFSLGEGRLTSIVSPTWGLMLSHQAPRRLGPRSLVPPLFFERCVRAYSRPGCCLPTSATAYDVRATNPDSRFLAGTVAMTTFLFLRITHDQPRRAAVTRGEPRFVREP